ncbi:MAG: hypothetical protein IVW57_07440 [Ktedonobacterales bacterium]|nr:hypothetical protein [Ktedonobacterales bacterium]
MPLYEYYCASCRGKFELLTSYEASQSEIVCTRCHGTQVRKLFSVFARAHDGGADDYNEFGSYDDGGDGEDASFGENIGGGCCGGSCGGGCAHDD